MLIVFSSCKDDYDFETDQLSDPHKKVLDLNFILTEEHFQTGQDFGTSNGTEKISEVTAAAYTKTVQDVSLILSANGDSRWIFKNIESPNKSEYEGKIDKTEIVNGYAKFFSKGKLMQSGDVSGWLPDLTKVAKYYSKNKSFPTIKIASSILNLRNDPSDGTDDIGIGFGRGFDSIEEFVEYIQETYGCEAIVNDNLVLITCAFDEPLPYNDEIVNAVQLIFDSTTSQITSSLVYNNTTNEVAQATKYTTTACNGDQIPNSYHIVTVEKRDDGTKVYDNTIVSFDEFSICN